MILEVGCGATLVLLQAPSQGAPEDAEVAAVQVNWRQSMWALERMSQ